jgi:hypothetical protein
MAKYAKINNNNLVVDLLESDADFINSLSGDGYTYKESFEHSYDTDGNLETNPKKIPAGVGMTYDLTADAFIPESPYGSWTWNATTWEWEPPVARPTELETVDEDAGTITSVFWNESEREWQKIVRDIPS